jgi:hypothetical protein
MTLSSRMLFRFRSAILANLIMFGIASSLWGREYPQPRPESLRMFFGEGLGFEAETGRPGALVARELLRVCEGRLAGSMDISSALGIVEGTDSSLIDSTGFHFGYRFAHLWQTDLFLDSFMRYRFLFIDAWELRIGGTVIGRWGAARDECGLYGDWALGFEGIRTSILYLPNALWEGDPLLRVALGWRFSREWSCDAALESFSDEDATYFFRTLFDFGTNLCLDSFALRTHLMLKYSDFFTPTGYLDGLAFRMAVTIPLRPE